MERLAEAFAALLERMPPVLSGAVVLGLAIVALVYAWRRAGVEVAKERAAAEAARAEAIGTHLSAIAGSLKSIEHSVSEIKSDTNVLMDRGRK